jgi:hypothetical protein
VTVVAARTCTLPSTSTRTDDGTTPTESAPANPSLLKSSTREMLWSTSGHASASAPAPSAVVQLADGRYTATNWLGWSTRLCALAATALVVVVVLLLLLRVLATAAAVVVVAPAAVVVEAVEVALRHGSSAQARVSASPSPATHAAPPVAAYVRTSNVRVCDEFAPHTQ